MSRVNIHTAKGIVRGVVGSTAYYPSMTNVTVGTAVTPVPEPSTYGLMGVGALAGIAFLRRRKAAKA